MGAEFETSFFIFILLQTKQNIEKNNVRKNNFVIIFEEKNKNKSSIFNARVSENILWIKHNRFFYPRPINNNRENEKEIDIEHPRAS